MDLLQAYTCIATPSLVLGSPAPQTVARPCDGWGQGVGGDMGQGEMGQEQQTGREGGERGFEAGEEVGRHRVAEDPELWE